MTALRVYIGYATGDSSLFCELRNHLSAAGVIVLHRGEVPPGENEGAFAATLLSAADLFVPLVTAEYLASPAGVQEIARASQPIVPVIARPCTLSGTSLSGLQTLPRSGKAVTSARDRAAAWSEVATEILRLASYPAGSTPAAEPRSQDSPLFAGSTDAHPAAPPLPSVSPSLPTQAGTSGRSKFSLSLKWGSLALTITLVPLLGLVCNHLINQHPLPIIGHEDFGILEDLAAKDLHMGELYIVDIARPDLTKHKNHIVRQEYDMTIIGDMIAKEDMPIADELSHVDGSTQIKDMVTTNSHLDIGAIRRLIPIYTPDSKEFDIRIGPWSCINPPNGVCPSSDGNSRALLILLYQINQYVNPCHLRVEDLEQLFNSFGKESDRYFCKIRVIDNSYAHTGFRLLSDTKYIIMAAVGRGVGKNSIRIIDAAKVRQTGKLPTIFVRGYDLCLEKRCEESNEVQCP